MEIIRVIERSYAYDILIFENTEETLQGKEDILIKQLKKYKMVCKTEKTKTVIVGDEIAKHTVKMEGNYIKEVNTYKTTDCVAQSKFHF